MLHYDRIDQGHARQYIQNPVLSQLLEVEAIRGAAKDDAVVLIGNRQIAHAVVVMKDEVERLREQVQNVE